MLVPTDQLGDLAGRVTMVDGGFDPLHPGHVAYFEAAAALGAPVLCNISGDDWVSRKHAPLLSQSERGILIAAIRWIDHVHLSQTSTLEVLAALEPRYYAKGIDWQDRLPAAEQALCSKLGIEIVYLDTVLDSSTAILERYARDARS